MNKHRAHTFSIDSDRVEVDAIPSSRWSELLQQFSDSSVYQTWPYEGVIHPRFEVSRLVVYKGNSVIGLVQASLARAPILGSGVAYIRSGPVWQAKNRLPNQEHFLICLRAILQEYAVRRGLMVRIVTRLNAEGERWAVPVFEEAGFRFFSGSVPSRTIIVNLLPSLDELQRGLHSKWRNCLNSAAKKGQEIRISQDDEAFDHFGRIYRAMRIRKQFETTTDFDAFRKLQTNLEQSEKMTVILCGSHGNWYSGAIVSSLGRRGIYLFGATTGQGLENKGSYLVQWKAIEILKDLGCTEYDLNGINPETNPTTYRFKARLAGRNGRDVTTLGTFEACFSPASRFIVGVGMQCQKSLRALRGRRLRPSTTAVLK